jgi:nitrate reductase assembly molybdenum cofactor insertion protein NarJ
MTNPAKYDLFSPLVAYPDPGLPQAVDDCRAMLRLYCPGAVDTLETFALWVATTPLHDQEEIYTRTFHIQAICYLDLGFVLFGEDYKRGEFLVHMKREQAQAGNNCGDELPDNLVNVLNLLPMLKDQQLLNDLCGRVMIPALRKMLAEFESARMALRERMLKRKHNAILLQGRPDQNVYANVLQALLQLLLTDFEEKNQVRPSMAQPFLTGASVCGTCATHPQPRQKNH